MCIKMRTCPHYTTHSLHYYYTLQVISVEEPSVRQAGIIVDSVEALLDSLKNKAKVI